MAPRKKKVEIVEMTDIVKEQQPSPKKQLQNSVEITDVILPTATKPYVRPLRKL